MLRIDADRFAKRFSKMSAIGRTAGGGVHRLALTDADKACRDLLRSWCEAAGFSVEIDQVGSMFATRTGRDAHAPPILIGSHLDSQPYAGAYDGPLGVLAALEVLETLEDAGLETTRRVQLVNWTNEEGARFRPPLIASATFAGLRSVDETLAVTDGEGRTYGAELERIGYAGRLRPGWPIAGYIEVHIEQGTVLESAGAVIGVVTGGVGIRDFEVTVVGEDTHAGPLPMSERRDALVGAASMILSASEIGLAHVPDARVTVGRIAVPSNSHSVVPGRAVFTLDLRHPDEAGLDALETALWEAFAAIGQACDLAVERRSLWTYAPFAFDPGLRRVMTEAAAGHGYVSLDLPSRAGHDAWNMARLAPTAMIFIPCRAGISHNEREYADPEHMAASAQVLLDTVLAFDASR